MGVAPGVRATSRTTPISTNPSCARNSVVRSTTVEAAATGQGMPSRVTVRAPITKPPTSENGSRPPAASRTIRPQIATGRRQAGLWGSSTNQHRPSNRNSTICQAQTAAKPPIPTAPVAWRTGPKPNQPITAVPSNNPAKPKPIDTAFTGLQRPVLSSSGSSLRAVGRLAVGLTRQPLRRDRVGAVAG